MNPGEPQSPSPPPSENTVTVPIGVAPAAPEVPEAPLEVPVEAEPPPYRAPVRLIALIVSLAACWLAYAAVRLWAMSPDMTGAARRGAVARVFLTTLVNPKAMIVGTMMIPQGSPDDTALRIAVFILLSSIAGLGWVALGAALPGGVRRRSYKGAAVVLGGFSLYALSSALA